VIQGALEELQLHYGLVTDIVLVTLRISVLHKERLELPERIEEKQGLCKRGCQEILTKKKPF
jgi:hypothetical protein